MDADQRFIYALLKANRNEQDKFYTQQIPRGVFKLREKEINWLYQFRERRGVYPSLALYHTHFPDPEDRLRRHKDSISATLQPILDMSMFTQMRDLTVKAKEMIDKGTEISTAMEFFKQGANRLSSFSTDYVDINLEDTPSVMRTYRNIVKQSQMGGLLDTPWPTMTKLVKYYMGGNTVALVSRMNMGKTWLLVEWANYYASRGIPCIFTTKEMTSEQISMRVEAKRYRLPYDAMKGGDLRPAIWKRWQKDRCFKDSYPLIVSGSDTIEGTGLEHVITKIEQYSPRVVFIDGAYLLEAKGLPFNVKQNERYSYISKRIKSLAIAKNIVIIFTLQQNRDAERKDGTTGGNLAAVYGSDAWAQDADTVAEFGGKRGSAQRTVTIQKGRDSAVGEFNVKFMLEPYPIFSELGRASSAGQGTIFKGIQ